MGNLSDYDRLIEEQNKRYAKLYSGNTEIETIETIETIEFQEVEDNVIRVSMEEHVKIKMGDNSRVITDKYGESVTGNHGKIEGVGRETRS